MPVNIIMGPSGCGKTHILYSRIIREAIANPDKKYILIVPVITAGTEADSTNA